MTVIAAVSLLPSLVAVIVAEPFNTPVTTPVDETVAMLVLLDDQVITRPVSTLPAASFVTTESETVAPSLMLADAGETVTEFTGGRVTVSADVPLFPSLVAVIVAVPAATPVTTPTDETVATAVLLELQVMLRPVSVFPAKSFVVATNTVVPPTNTLDGDGATVTVETGSSVTVTTDVPVFPSLSAVMVAVPGTTPVTTPVDDTVATSELLEVHETARSVTTVPLASVTVTDNGVVCVVATLTVAGRTATVATGI